MNKKGNVIVPAIIVVMVLVIIAGTCLTIASSYQRKPLYNHANRQAYLNGVTMCDLVAEQLNGPDAQDYLPISQEVPKIIERVQLSNTDEQGYPVDANLGEITGKIYYGENNELFVQIESVFADQKERVTLKLKKRNNTWYKVEYSEYGEVNENE